MHCTNCGSPVAPGTRFCAACGAPARDPEETQLARAPSGPHARRDLRSDSSEQAASVERTIFTTRPTLLFIKLGYAAAALGAMLFVMLLALIRFVEIPLFVSIPLAMALFLIPAYFHLKRNTVRYTLTDSKIEIDQGLVAHTTRNIPLRNIQDVTVSATITQRLLGYGNLMIDNASEQGGATILRNIHDPRHHADMLLRELRRWH